MLKQRYFAFNYLYFSIAMSYNPIQYCKRKMIHDNEVEADRFVPYINKMNLSLMRKLLWIPY